MIRCRMIQTIIILVVLSIFSLSYADKIVTSSKGFRAVAGRILVRPVFGANMNNVLENLAEKGMPVYRASAIDGTRINAEKINLLKAPFYFMVSIPSNISPFEAAEIARLVPGVKEASPDFIRYPFFIPDDPYYVDSQQNMNQIGMERVWNVTFGSPEIIVAVIDTGYMKTGLEDAAPNILDGYDFWGDDDDPTDFFGHGTLVANVIAEATDNGLGAAGMAPFVSILPIKVFPDDEGGAEDSDIIDAINYAVSSGAMVVNMSFGGGDDNPIFEQALQTAYDAGLFLVAATGNDGKEKISRPSSYETVFAVGSCDKHDFGLFPGASKFSNYGTGLDIVAPGEDIIQEGYTSEHGVTYYSAYGTSMSAPHVSAAVALMLAMGGPGDPDEIASILRETAKSDLGGWDKFIGYGELNVSGAIAAYHEPLPNSPPEAIGYAEIYSGIVPETVLLFGDDSTDPDGNIVSYSWELHGGQTSTGKVVQIEILEAGEYEAILTVTDEEGESDSTIVNFELTDPPPPDASEDSDDDEKGCGCSINGTTGKTGDGYWFLALLLAMIIFNRKCRKLEFT